VSKEGLASTCLRLQGATTFNPALAQPQIDRLEGLLRRNNLPSFILLRLNGKE
jgi:hypothetical protein